MLHREIPFFRICFPMCCGIITGLYFYPHAFFILFFIAVIILLFFANLCCKNQSENYLFGGASFLSFYLLGILLYTHEKKSLTFLRPEPSVFVCTLSDYPLEKPNSLMLNVKLHQEFTGNEYYPVKGSMVLYLSKNDEAPSFIPGDRLTVKCTPAEIVNRGNPYEFDYKFHMEGLGIKYYSFIKPADILEHDTSCKRRLAHKALIIRHRIIRMYSERNVTPEMLPLVSALTLGEKSGLEPEQKQNFIRAGVMHIMAVSGLHAVILSLFVLNVLFFLKRRFNIVRILLAVLFLWLFAFVTGLTPSVMRATLMFTFVQAGNLMQRKVNGINSVLASAFVLMLVRPSVIFDAGFLLSYSAVIFIIAFYHHFYLLTKPKNRFADWIWQSAVVTIVAQLGTFALTVMLFNRFPVWFIFTNIIIVPLSSLAIILGCLLPVLYPFASLSGLTGFLLDRLTMFTETLTEKAAQLPFAGITGIGMKVTGCILLFGLLFTLLLHLTDRRNVSLKVILVLFLAWSVYSTAASVRTSRSNELIVYNINGARTIGIRTGKKLSIYSDTLIMDPEINRHRSVEGLKVTGHETGMEPVFLRAGDKKILVCGPPWQKMADEFKPDILIISGFGKGQGTVLSYVPAKIIVQSGLQVFTFGNKKDPEIHYIRRSGAYTTAL